MTTRYDRVACRRALPLLVLAAAGLMPGGCDGGAPDNVEEGTGTVARFGQGPRPDGVSGPNEPVTITYYIPQAAYADAYELQAAKVALARSREPDVRLFAEAMLVDHQRTSEALKSFVAENPVNIAIPDILDRRHRAMLDNLRDAADEEFDHVYVGQQEAAHQNAYYLHQSFANNGTNPELAEIARRAADIVQQHRERLEKLARKIPGPEI